MHFEHLGIRNPKGRMTTMRSRKENVLLNLLLGAGVYLIDSLRRRLPDVDEMSERARREYDDLTDRASGAFDRVSDSAGRAANVVRGEDNRTSSTAALLLGVGLGAGLCLLFASGQRGQHPS